jgi:hypothetical protein
MPIFCKECKKTIDGSMRQESYGVCEKCKKKEGKKKL